MFLQNYSTKRLKKYKYCNFTLLYVIIYFLYFELNCPQAASMSAPLSSLTVTFLPEASTIHLNFKTASRDGFLYSQYSFSLYKIKFTLHFNFEISSQSSFAAFKESFKSFIKIYSIVTLLPVTTVNLRSSSITSLILYFFSTGMTDCLISEFALWSEIATVGTCTTVKQW